MSSSQTIFLNGRRYDALTGKLIKDTQNDPSSNRNPSLGISPRKYTSSVKAIDGLIHSNNRHQSKKHHSPAPHTGRLVEHSKTLRRDIVTHPGVSKLKNHQQAAKNYINHSVTRSIEASAPAREALSQRARSIRQSGFVNRLNEYTTPARPVTPDPNAIQTTANSEVHLKNLDHLAQIESSLEPDDVFSEAALRLTDSAQPLTQKEIRLYETVADKLRISVKTLFILFMIVLVGIIGGTSGYIFKNNMAMFIADSRTSIHGILPTYLPKGAYLQSISYATGSSSGTIKLSYHIKNSTSKYYVIQEEASTWDSQELVDSVVQPQVGNNYKTYQIGGRSVFIYNSYAAWLDAGIYYIMINNAGLTNTQITQIVNTT